MSEEESSKNQDNEHDFNSEALELIYEQSLEKLRFEYNRVDQIDSKAIQLLGIIGIILTILVNTFMESLGNSGIPLSEFQKVYLFIGIVSLFASAFCYLGSILFYRTLNSAPSPDHLYKKYTDKEKYHVMDNATDAIRWCWKNMAKQRIKRLNYYKAAHVLLFLGIGFVFVVIILSFNYVVLVTTFFYSLFFV
jgi:hypothetical protein